MLLSHLLGHEYLGSSFNENQYDTAEECLFNGNCGSSTDGKDTTSDETCHNSVVWVILLSVANQQTIRGREDSSPKSKIPTKVWCPIPDMSQARNNPLFLGGVKHSFEEIEEGSTSAANGKPTAKIFEYAAWTRLSVVLHSRHACYGIKTLMINVSRVCINN